MKFVIQRVLQGSVKVNEKIVGEIGPGLVVLVGFTHSDKKENLKFAANKLLSMRLWDDDTGTRWKECVKDKKYSLLVVSQFTLYSFLKGNKPDYHNAMDPKNAIILYEEFLKTLRQIYPSEKIQSGLFGEMMQVSIINDGPVTINWEYPELPDKDAVSENNKNLDKESKIKETNKINLNNDVNKKPNNGKNINTKKNKKELFVEVEKDLDQLKLDNDKNIIDKRDSIDNVNQDEEQNDKQNNNHNLIKLPDEMK